MSHGAGPIVLDAGLAVPGTSPPVPDARRLGARDPNAQEQVIEELTAEQRVDAVFADYDNTRSPGCALGVIQDGELVLRRGYGMANLEYGIPLSPSSVFRIGSTSKQFTAASIVLLAEEEKLSLDDDVRMYLPELTDFGTPVTIRHLIHHTSGYRDYLTLATLAGLRDDDYYTDDDVLVMLSRQRELNFEPEHEYLYSNSGYWLLSQIVERASGVSLRGYAAQKIFKPLGMSNTHYHDDHTEMVPNRASGYQPTDGGGYRISMTTLPMIGDGGVFTTVDDLFKWDQNFYEQRIGGGQFLEQMLTLGTLNNGEKLDYAFGLGIDTYRGLEMVSHGGGFVGFRAQMIRFPQERFTVICLCNRGDANPTRFALKIADLYLEEHLEPVEVEEGEGEEDGDEAGEGPEEGEAVSLDPEQLAEFAGDYYSEEIDVIYRIRLPGDALELTVRNRPVRSLRPSRPDVFKARRLTLRFNRDSENRISGFQLNAGRVKNLRFTRTGT